tara:strand:+ start:2862 stop:3674 length:813 start_codon:yes stop_codon:yes gene_type:complete
VAFNPRPLIAYCKALGVPYFYVEDPIFERASSGSLRGTSICSFCARMKRGLLYKCVREEGYNKLVLAQHLDDMAESWMMSAFHNGASRTMSAAYTIANGQGDLDVIRPLAYTREILCRDFAKAAKLPVINENCPACFESPKERARVKKMLEKEESRHPGLFDQLLRAMKPLMDSETAEMLANSSKRRTALRTRNRNTHHKGKRSDKSGGKSGGASSSAVASSSSAAADAGEQQGSVIELNPRLQDAATATILRELRKRGITVSINDGASK